MREEFIPIYKRYIKEYGIESQIMMCIEEMSELTKELCKLQRQKYFGTENQSKVFDNIKEELADVLNMAEQLEYYFGESDIENIRKAKVDRSMIRDFNKK